MLPTSATRAHLLSLNAAGLTATYTVTRRKLTASSRCRRRSWGSWRHARHSDPVIRHSDTEQWSVTVIHHHSDINNVSPWPQLYITVILAPYHCDDDRDPVIRHSDTELSCRTGRDGKTICRRLVDTEATATRTLYHLHVGYTSSKALVDVKELWGGRGWHGPGNNLVKICFNPSLIQPLHLGQDCSQERQRKTSCRNILEFNLKLFPSSAIFDDTFLIKTYGYIVFFCTQICPRVSRETELKTTCAIIMPRGPQPTGNHELACMTLSQNLHKLLIPMVG